MLRKVDAANDAALSYAWLGIQLKEAAAKQSPQAWILAHPDSASRTAALQLHEQIDPQDIVSLERDPHVTLIGGIKDADWSTMRDLMEGMKPGSIMLGEPNVFELPDYDVLKLPVLYTGGLKSMHEFLRANTSNVQKFPDYHPHLTVAYLKKGTGRKYLQMQLPEVLKGMVPIRTMVYSKQNRHIPILRGDAA